MGVLVRSIWEAQGKCCSVCGEKLFPVTKKHLRRGWTWEHVWPQSRYAYFFRGNVLISHAECNNCKSDRDPTGCEIILLEAVNAQLETELTPRSRSYSDNVAAPSALAVALERALAA